MTYKKTNTKKNPFYKDLIRLKNRIVRSKVKYDRKNNKLTFDDYKPEKD